MIKHARKFKNYLNIAWIDYKKAFDSIPHSWLIRVLKIYKVNYVITNFVEQTMLNWKTIMMLIYENGCVKTEVISIKRGIFQGDSLSPLLSRPCRTSSITSNWVTNTMMSRSVAYCTWMT